MSNERKEDLLSTITKVLQIIFFFVIAFCTIYNLRLSIRQTNLIFKPVVGVVGVKTTRILLEEKEDNYQNTGGAKIQFIIENVGNLPAKDLKIKTIGKIGNTILPHTESEEDAGIVLIQNTKATNTATISKDIIERLVERKERLIYTVELSYWDWEKYKNYNYASRFEILVTQKSPLQFIVNMLPKK